MQRRDFLKMSLAASAVAVGTSVQAGVTTQPIDNRKVSRMMSFLYDGIYLRFLHI